MTESNKEWLFYDGECALCTNWARRVEGRLRGCGVGVMPLQTEWVREFVNRSADSLSARIHGDVNRGQAVRAPLEMKVLTTRGEALGGADALIYLTKYFWWGWGVRLVARVPGARFVLRRAYAWLARHRHCIGGRCEL